MMNEYNYDNWSHGTQIVALITVMIMIVRTTLTDDWNEPNDDKNNNDNGHKMNMK